MMMLPRRKHDFDLLDDMFTDQFFTNLGENTLMKTDIKEKNDKYIIDIDLPGYEKEDIKIELNKLAQDYKEEKINADEIQDVLMGIELSKQIDYEVLYKYFKEQL